MFNLLSSLWNVEESTVIYACNSVFFGTLLLTAIFVIILFRQESLSELSYTQEFVNKNYVNVLYSDNWDDDGDLPIILILPGNPGQAGYYQEFMQMLVTKCKSKFKACAVSHVGHSPALDRIFNVRDQVESKLQFITSKLKPESRLFIVGHSFGAYIALKLLEKGIRIEKVILLFPMFDNMAKMPKAENLTKMLSWQSSIVFIAWLTCFLPQQLKDKMIQFYSSRFSSNIQDHMTTTISELIEPNALRNVFGLAQSELSIIKEPDFKLIRQHKDKIVFYYGMHDLWAPLDCLRRLRQAVPAVNFHIADEEVLHTFMFGSCDKVATMTAAFLTENITYDIRNLIPTYEQVAEAAKDDPDYDFCDS